MPELPEVETIKKELDKAILGKKVVDIIVNNAKVIREPKKERFIKELKNIVIKKIIRKGKLLIFELSSRSARSSGKSLTIHLKMTGQLIYPGDGAVSRVSFRLSDGKLLDFNDRRLFGELRIIDDWRKLKFIKELGPEPFEITAKQFRNMLAGKSRPESGSRQRSGKTKIKVLLLDQKFISGVGNLYANEALFRAKINPQRPANSLSGKEKELLLKEIKNTLSEAIKYNGSSVDQYVQLSGRPGNYVKYHKVYDREGEKCFRCGGTIKRITLGGRGTYFCPVCQKY